jgi:inorganic pyrophosphatase
MRIDAIAIGLNPPGDVNVIVEVPIGGEPIKYELDKAAGTLVVDRVLHTPVRYPGNYGFVPHTLMCWWQTPVPLCPAPSLTCARSACFA